MKQIKLKKILIMSLVLIALGTTITAISAENLNNTTNTAPNGSIAIDGIQFKIPSGFTAVESEQDHSEAGDTEHMDGTSVDSEITSEYINTNGEKLNIKVGSKKDSKIETLNIPNAQKKTIAGKEGFFWTQMDDGKTEYKFEYLNDGKVVKITTNNEEVINQVLS